MEHQPPAPQRPMVDPMGFPRDTSPMSLRDWVITLFLQAIPVVGFILLIVWAVDNNSNVNKQNWARASLILAAIVIGLAILFLIFFLGVLTSIFRSGSQNY